MAATVVEYYVEVEGGPLLPITVAVCRRKVAELELVAYKLSRAPDYNRGGNEVVGVGKAGDRTANELRLWKDRLARLTAGFEGTPFARRIIPV